MSEFLAIMAAPFAASLVVTGIHVYLGLHVVRRGVIFVDIALAQIAAPRLLANPRWLAQQKKRVGRRYESYWYSTEKGQWTKHAGWPPGENWKKVQAWIVRRKLSLGAATRASFSRDLGKVFRELYPLLRFTSVND